MMPRKVFCSRKVNDSEIEFVYDDGSREVKLVADVVAEEKARRARELADFNKYKDNMLKEMGYNDWSEFRGEIRDSIQITHRPIDMGYGDDRDIEVEDADDLEPIHERDYEQLESDTDLQAIAAAYDALDETGHDSNLAELVNDYVTLHGLCLPAWEIYRHRLGYRLGYRVGIAEAFIIPEDNEEEPPWVDNLYELRRLLLIVEGNEEYIEDSGVRSESTRWLYRAHVNNGQIKSNDEAQLQNWRRVIDHNYGNSSRPSVGNATMPILVEEEFRAELMTVASFMDKQIDSVWEKDSREQRWQAILDLVANGYEHVDLNKNVRVICVNGGVFDYQLVRYWLAHPELPVPSKRWVGDTAATGEWEYENDYDPMRLWWRDSEE